MTSSDEEKSSAPAGRNSFCTERKLCPPREVGPPVFQAFAQSVRNRFASSIVDPESRVGPPAEHVVQFEEIANALPAIAKGIVEYLRSLPHAAAATRQQIGNGFGGQLDHDDG